MRSEADVRTALAARGFDVVEVPPEVLSGVQAAVFPHRSVVALSGAVEPRERPLVLAHELAHVVLGHDPAAVENCDDIEAQADRWASLWLAGGDPDECPGA